MAGHRLDRYYSSFGGVDTRSNKLLESPKTFRQGSKNFRYNFQDEIQKANGFQRKALSSFVNLGEIEYKYTDLNTGEAKTQILCVGNDGLLYKKLGDFLKFSNLGTATSYSFYYDEVADSFKFKFDSYAEITVSDSMTMDQLRVAINAQGPTCTIVDDDGATVTGSTKLAYYIDVVIDEELQIGVINNASSQYWEEVTYPSVGNSNTEVPFVTSRDFYTEDSYEGISSINIGNCIEITDGGFPMKYDGKVVCRLGMPKILRPGDSDSTLNLVDRNLSGFTITPAIVSDGGITPNKVYKYVFQHGYVDYNGSEIMGAFETYGDDLYMNVNSGFNNAISIFHTGILYNPNFPVFSCKIDGGQQLLDAGGTITVYPEHNIKVGMLLRIPVNNALLGLPGYSFIMSHVSAVTATTITLDFGLTSADKYPFQEVRDLVATRSSGNNFVSLMGTSTTGNTTISSQVITAIPSTATFLSGDQIFCANFPAGTRIISIDSATQVTVDQNASATSAGIAISFNYGIRVRPGALVTGTGIPPNTFVTSVSGNGSTLNLSNNVTTTTTDSLNFVDYPTLLIADQVLNGGYAQDVYKNKISNPNFDFGFCPDIPFGAFTRVYRSTADTDSLYKLFDLPLGRSGGVGIFIDDFADGPGTDTLSRLSLVDANQGADLPRACKYLTKWQDQLVQSGRPVDPTIKDDPYPTSFFGIVQNSWGSQDTSYFGYIYSEAHLCDFQSIYWTDSANPEGFPQDGLHEFLIETKASDKMKGIAPNKDAIFAFKERSTGVVVGSLADNDLSLEVLEDDIGLCNHRTIQEVRGSLVWLDPINGFYSCVAGRLPENIGFNISDYQKINSQGLDYNTACAANFRKENIYICSVGTTTFVFDYANDGSLRRNCWYIWDRFNVKSVLATSDDKLLIDDGQYSLKMKVTNTKYDFTDHKSAIDMILNMAWLTGGYPTIDKHWINLWMNSVQGGFTVDVSQYGNYLDTVISELLGINFPLESTGKKAVKNSFKAAIPKLSGTSFGIRNNEKNQYVRFQGLEVELSGDFDNGEPKK